MPGQPDPSTGALVMIDCTKVDVIDSDGVASRYITPGNANFQVYVEFTLSGAWAPWFTTLGVAAQYTIQFFADQKGGPFDAAIGSIGPISLIPHQYSYGQAETQVTVAANTLLAGLYDLTAVVTFGGGLPMTGFNEAMLQIT